MPQAFRVGLLLKDIIRNQEKAVGLLGNLCRDVFTYRAWMDKSILYTHLHLEGIELQGVSQFPEWKKHVQLYVGQIKVTDIPVKTIQQ